MHSRTPFLAGQHSPGDVCGLTAQNSKRMSLASISKTGWVIASVTTIRPVYHQQQPFRITGLYQHGGSPERHLTQHPVVESRTHRGRLPAIAVMLLKVMCPRETSARQALCREGLPLLKSAPAFYVIIIGCLPGLPYWQIMRCSQCCNFTLACRWRAYRYPLSRYPHQIIVADSLSTDSPGNRCRRKIRWRPVQEHGRRYRMSQCPPFFLITIKRIPLILISQSLKMMILAPHSAPQDQDPGRNPPHLSPLNHIVARHDQRIPPR